MLGRDTIGVYTSCIECDWLKFPDIECQMVDSNPDRLLLTIDDQNHDIIFCDICEINYHLGELLS